MFNTQFTQLNKHMITFNYMNPFEIILIAIVTAILFRKEIKSLLK
jgi:hypothetical protein